MKKLILCFVAAFCICCGQDETSTKAEAMVSSEEAKSKINSLLHEWHDAASEADYNSYFDMMAEESVFIGTDATENWNKQEFKKWAKPYFDQGEAWSFTALERNIFLGEYTNIAWFDELLETQMGLCRGSGIIVKDNNVWKIKHYVLSISVPNEKVNEVVEGKIKFDQELIESLKNM